MNNSDNLQNPIRPDWHEYFMSMAKLASTRSTCLAFPVGAVIVKDKQILATGYNGSPSGSEHCTTQGFCYPGLISCDTSKTLPSRAVHAETNAIAQASKHGMPTAGAEIYVTLEPCLNCLKLIISAGIKDVYYEKSFYDKESNLNKIEIRDLFIKEGLVNLHQIQIRKDVIDLVKDILSIL